MSGLPFAVVRLHAQADSSFMKYEVSDEKGFFEFDNLPPGEYRIVITLLGFEEYRSEPIQVNGEVLLPDIQMVPAKNELAEVSVRAHKPIIENLPDRLVFNVEQVLTARDGNAYDLLTQAPGLRINPEGSFSIRGKLGVLVLVDNRENFLQGEELVAFLKGFSSEQIQSIEIITRPSAKYAAAGTGGIINIRTKKSAQKGYSMNLSSGWRQGKTFHLNNNLAFTRRTEKFFWQGNYSYLIHPRYNTLFMDNLFLHENGNLRATQNYAASMKAITHALQGGVDYAHKKTVVGLNFSVSLEDDPLSKQTSTTVLFGLGGQKTGQVGGERSRAYQSERYSANLNVVQTFQRPGMELALAADFFKYGMYYQYFIDNTRSTGSGSERIHFKQNLPNDISIFSSKLDFTLPISEQGSVQMGTRVSYTQMDNSYDFLLFDTQKSDYLFDPSRSVRYVFDENIMGAYMTYRQAFLANWDLEAGLRMEHTVNRSTEMLQKDVLDKNYTRLFPNLAVNYNPNEDHAFSLSYSSRFNRPVYETLIPGYKYTDILYYTYGNPRQDPEIGESLDLSFIYKGKWTFNFNVSRLKGMFFTINLPEIDNLALGETYENRGSSRILALSMDYSEQVFPWYSAVLSTTLGHIKTTDHPKYQYRSAQGIYGSAQVINRFKLGKGWSGELSGTYNSGQQESFVFYLHAYGSLVAGIGKELFKGKANVKFQVRDPFLTLTYDYDAKFIDLHQKWILQEDTRQVGLSFQYNFSSGNQTKSRKRLSSNEEEKERMN